MKKLFISIAVALFAIIGTVQAQLPSVTLKTIDGKTVKTDTLSNDGKPFIIDFLQLGVSLATVSWMQYTKFTKSG